jgi:glycosyltransferase involved in cell wall biosynthesis
MPARPIRDTGHAGRCCVAKLLFLTPKLPFPADRGQHVRISNLLRACARDFEVTFVGPAPDGDVDVGALKDLCAAVHLVSDDAKRPSLLALARHVLDAGLLATPSRHATFTGFERALSDLDLASFDVIWVERPVLAALVRRYWSRTIVDLDDVEHRKLWRSVATSGWRRSTPLDCLRIVKHYLIETRLSRRFRASLVCSAEDRDHLGRQGLRNAVVIPNGTLLRPLASQEARREGPWRLAFMGNVAYAPNADAIAFLTGSVLPLAARTLGPLRLEIFGPNAPEAAPDDPWSVYRGFVPDIAAELADCDVFVAPVRFGSGTKLKIIDAMALGLPIVTTAVGAEGLGLFHGVSAMICETPEELAEAIGDLVRDPAAARRMGEEASRIADRDFRWERIMTATADWLAGIADDAGRSAVTDCSRTSHPAARPASASTNSR